ncbi:MAG: NADH:ubiquinone oxidoreductase [Candidatus Scalindua sp.]|jgi:coenzyme F420-reducing hydrogenase gamma subunit|nr:NADH:ubiquinone oxidoreductase [Candidatus Scalindua sp.]MBT5305526.1 NADH:ubiquinone oxidoreductase [Candidatus Scalindua sp.]MBT6228970.1 NADH:ubiquinone oxidoreductase [Candidatus Scalindua sp.]MBT6561768.1 NADH:ubiquinone oxidoreductase [Candidatus Scalindua sp.]MBT7210409.1 NADH:ubiquinone oxidoreductase [Candidatus Scalindua sp.]
MTKPRVAFFSFSSCEGCQLVVLTIEEQLLELVNLIDIVSFREAMSEKSEDYDIVFVEGSITTTSEIERIKKIRNTAKVIIALGACATIGGVNCLKNQFEMEKVKDIVYGEKAGDYETIPARPIEAVIKVDYWIQGCPIDKDEFIEVTKALLLGKKPRIPEYPVCVECQMRENVCLFEKGMVCMGPVTRAGCKAICPTYNDGCTGCRGLIDDPNLSSHKNLLSEHGLTVDEAISQYMLFGGNSKEKYE